MFRRKENSFSSSNRRTTSTKSGSFGPNFATFFSLFTALSSPVSPVSTDGYAAELRFFSNAAANPAAQTYQDSSETDQYTTLQLTTGKKIMFLKVYDKIKGQTELHNQQKKSIRVFLVCAPMSTL